MPGPVQSIPQHNLRAPVATFMMSWESGRAVQSIPRNLRAPEVPESEDSEPKMERVTEMMSRGSGRAVQSIPRNLWDPPMTRMMSWESGRAGIPKQPQLDSGAGEAAAD